MNPKAKPKESLQLVGVKVPPALLKRLDKAARQGGRTRSSEARMRLERSLREEPTLLVQP